jgi:hypothetical protein
MISLAAPARAGVEHVLYAEVLEYQCAVCVHQFPAQFMGKVFSSVGHALMDVSNDLAAFGSFVFVPSSLHPPKFNLISAKETWIAHSQTIRERCKGCQTHVNSNSNIVVGQSSRFYFTSKTGVPIPHSVSLYVQGLYASLDGAVLDYFDCSDFGNHHPMIQQLKPRLLEGEAIVSAITLETRITNFIRACLHAAKERLKSKVNPFLHILQNLRMYLLEFRVFTLPRSQHFICVIQGYGSLLTLPRILADCKSSVIHKPA